MNFLAKTNVFSLELLRRETSLEYQYLTLDYSLTPQFDSLTFNFKKLCCALVSLQSHISRRYFYWLRIANSFALIVSGEAPQVPVASSKSGSVFEKRLIEAYIAEHGKDPVSGDDLTTDDLIELKCMSLYFH